MYRKLGPFKYKNSEIDSEMKNREKRTPFLYDNGKVYIGEW